MASKKNPRVLPARDQVNETQRKSLGLGTYMPRMRETNEALPRTILTSRITSMPVMLSVRPGAEDFLTIQSRGYST